jgi:peptide-methionine (R)-S-oxide reductase
VLVHRRTFLLSSLSAAALLACGGSTASAKPSKPAPPPDAVLGADGMVTLTPEQWKGVLTPEEFYILREQGTERAFTGDLWDHKADGVYICAGCGLPLFDSETKFKSGTGWPSFYQPIADNRVLDKTDRSYGMIRVENVCKRCGGHLGHVFPDGPKPTGMRFCINSASLDFVPRKMVKKVLQGEPVLLGGWDGGAK